MVIETEIKQAVYEEPRQESRPACGGYYCDANADCLIVSDGRVSLKFNWELFHYAV